MRSTRLFLALLVTLGLLGPGINGIECPAVYVEGEGYRGVILTPAQAPPAGLLFGEEVTGFWTPGHSDVAALEARLRGTLEAAKSSPDRLDPTCSTNAARRAYVSGEIAKILEHLTEYRRQYLGIRHSEGRRIWVNFFPDAPPTGSDTNADWESQLVLYLDGGFWYWQIQFDPEAMIFVEFHSNGYA